MIMHGFDKNAWKRYIEPCSWEYDITFPGYKYNLSDINAAIAFEQLKKNDILLKKRRHIVKYI
jgi:dTDP-4-amino-4,6-dideoxygalactose transaminase